MTLVGLLLTVAVFHVASTTLSHKELVAKYNKIKKINHQDNTLRSEANEREHFLAFKRTSNYIENHNADSNSHWKADYNEFATMLEAEKEQFLGLNISEVEALELRRQEEVTKVVRLETLGKIPTSMNYEKKLPPVKGQGGCGSCWAFGTSAPLEYQINRRKGGIVILAEQQWVDCVYDRSGCSGGWMSTAYKWSRDNNNLIAKEADYPYKAAYGKCKKNMKSALSGLKIVDVKSLDDTDDDVVRAVADKSIGVLATAVQAGKSFFSYKNGIYDDSKGCAEKVNHAVVIVGYGISDGMGYFRLRNSWGGWGDKGHMNIRRGLDGKTLNMCDVTRHAMYPNVSDGKDDDDDDDDDDDNDGDGGCSWKRKSKSKLKGGLTKMKYDLEEAKEKCEKDKECMGITCKGDKCQLNKSDKVKDNKKATAYVKECS